MHSECNVIYNRCKNVFGKYNQQDDEETSGQIDEESEDQISNNDAGEEFYNNEKWIFEFGEANVPWGTDVIL